MAKGNEPMVDIRAFWVEFDEELSFAEAIEDSNPNHALVKNWLDEAGCSNQAFVELKTFEKDNGEIESEGEACKFFYEGLNDKDCVVLMEYLTNNFAEWLMGEEYYAKIDEWLDENGYEDD